MRTALFLAALVFAAPVFAGDDLNPEKAAQIERDTDKALKEVDKKFGNKKSSELSSDERREVIRERSAAEKAVLEKHNVEPRAYISYTARQSRSEREATKQAGQALEAKEKAAQVEKEKEPAAPKEIIIQRGGAGKEPIVLVEKEGAAPMVTEGLPQEAIDDQNAASHMTDSSTEAAPKGKK